MAKEKMKVPDLRSVRLLVDRILLDDGFMVEADQIKARLVDEELSRPQLRLSYPVGKLRVTTSSVGVDVGEMTGEAILVIAR